MADSDLGSYGPVGWEGASTEEAQQVGRIVTRAIRFEENLGRELREKFNRFNTQYRGFKGFRAEWVKATPNDRDGMVLAAEEKWGAGLHIPMSFRTIETIVPRAIANMPKILILPRDEQFRKNAETMRLLIDAQQNQISIDLPLQAVMRSGRINGLGVSKDYWRTETTTRRRMERDALEPSKYVLGPPKAVTTFDDPMFEDVDVFDFMWDPFGSDMRTCEWAMHRRWMSTAAVLQRVTSKTWATPSAQKLNEEKIRTLGVSSKFYDQVWEHRMAESGLSTFRAARFGEHPHELLEFHDGERVLSVLDRQVLVQDGENPTGEKPFSIHRPTPLNKEFVGIGDLEPIEHLQRELDTLRSQRRDSATMALARGYAFDGAAIERDDLEFGPNAAIEVSNATPRDAIMGLPLNEVPGSGYQEEQAIMANLEAIPGMADALNNQPGGGEGTATEATLSQAALGRRIQLSARRFEEEIIRPTARRWVGLNQAHIQENRPDLLIPGQGGQEELPEGQWRRFPVGPGELEGDFEIEPDGGAMAERNIPQDRADGQFIMSQLAHDFYVNPTKARLRVMELYGFKHPQSWLRSPEPSVPQSLLRMLMAAGVDPALLMQAVLKAREVSAPMEGPSANQITEQIPMEGTA